MKKIIVAFAFLGVLALTVLPGHSASAAVRKATPASTATGARSFAVSVPVTPAVARALVQEYGPDYVGLWKPRVYCNGGSSGPYSQFNANIEWGGNGNPIIPAFLRVWGEVWDGCGGTAYAYLAYTNGLSGHNDKIGTAPYYTTDGVDKNYSSDFATYGNIRVDVCEQYNGWRCGKAVGP